VLLRAVLAPCAGGLKFLDEVTSFSVELRAAADSSSPGSPKIWEVLSLGTAAIAIPPKSVPFIFRIKAGRARPSTLVREKDEGIDRWCNMARRYNLKRKAQKAVGLGLSSPLTRS